MSTELYVILFTIAAMIVGLLVKPRERGQAETSFCTGTLDRDVDNTPRIEFRCLDNGDIILRRCGLHSLTESATVALAITRIPDQRTLQRTLPYPLQLLCILYIHSHNAPQPSGYKFHQAFSCLTAEKTSPYGNLNNN